MLKINQERLVIQSVMGEIRHPRVNRVPYVVDRDGYTRTFPSVQGICYNIRIGDSVYGFEGDHLEPAVTIRNTEDRYNNALNFLACIGNRATVISGDAKGSVGYCTGKHGGIQDVMVDFPREIMEKMAPGDKILIQSVGQGMKLLDYPDVTVMNIDPELLLALGIEEKDGKLVVPVAAVIPPYLMGSGFGPASAFDGDYDLQTGDEQSLIDNGLTDLKFGDVVYIEDNDNTNGRSYRKGSGTVGVIIHGNCVMHGHGPGITAILSCKTDKLVPKRVEKANISDFIFKKY